MKPLEPDPLHGQSGADESDERLDSWKAVASYLGRSDKTVRRWEEKEGLPIHRLHHDKRGSVYAYKRELDAWWELRKEIIEVDDRSPAGSEPPAPVSRGPAMPGPVWMVAGMVLAVVLFACLWGWVRPGPARARNVQFSRLTDFVGLEDSPAISPDGKMVTFIARTEGRRQIWVRLLAGGVPLQVTRDDADHEQPRWAPDSSSLIYYTPSPSPGEQGTIWEIPALGGPPRRIAAALGGGDCSHDGRHIALFRAESGITELVTISRHGSAVQRVRQVVAEDLNAYPRWSPDDRWIAFQTASGSSFDERIFVVAAAGGQPREVARGEDLRGMSWIGDGSGLVYSSSSGSTVLYPPIFNLRMVLSNGATDRQLTFGDISYVEPDLHPSGKLVVSRVRSQVDIWKFPIGGPPEENTRKGMRITEQTGQVQTPSVSPDGREMVYLSDSGGHGNLWIAKTSGSVPRQITFERDPAVAVGVPVWSPAGNYIVFILTRTGRTAQWLVHPDGSGLRQLIPAGIWAYWSADGRWVYYVVIRNGAYCIERVPIDGGAPVLVRYDNAVAPAAVDGSQMYYAVFLKRENRWWDFEVRRARPENGNFEVLTRIAGARVPHEPLNFHMILSPDAKWLATPLTDGTTTNLWLLPADGGPMRQITDFGKRATLIVRRVSWSPDSKQLYAAVSDCDTDIVMLDGLLPT
ncbi:MAG: hypothetical protein M3O35_04355 [Acidobacteriota bacterium]|nr:hypothetical protein [Acidobacteriota bacterium]